MKGKLVVVVLVVFSVSNPVMVGVGAAAPSESSTTDLGPDGPDIAVNATNVDGSEQLRYELTIPSTAGLGHLTFFVGTGGRVVSADGVERTSRGQRTKLAWTGESDRVRLVIETGGAATSNRTESGESFTGDGWSLGRVPFVQVQWRAVGASRVEHVRPLGETVGALEDDSVGIYGDRYALLGETTERTVTAKGQQIRLVSPTGTEFGPNRDELLSVLATASRQLAVGDRDDEVLLLALPDPARRGGESFPIRDEGWVSANEPVDTPNSVWLHEYVHTRQSFELAADMQWFREASAEYYAARLAYEQGLTTEAEMHSHIDGQDIHAALTDPSTWEHSRVPYRKGARVLALVDQNIRTSTDGSRSLEDVFRRLNAHDGPVTFADFKRVVSEVGGHSMDAWLDRYVAGTRPVASFYDHDPARAGLFGTVETTLQTGGSALVFFVVATAFSVVASVPLYTFLRRVDPETLQSRPPRVS